MVKWRIQYKLVGRKAVPCNAHMEWARWFETADRRVAQTTLADGEIWISTVFLGLDHQWGDGPPLLFETMVFGEEHEQRLLGLRRMVRSGLDTFRYSTWDEAERGHHKVVRMIEQRLARAARVAKRVSRRAAKKT